MAAGFLATACAAPTERREPAGNASASGSVTTSGASSSTAATTATGGPVGSNTGMDDGGPPAADAGAGSSGGTETAGGGGGFDFCATLKIECDAEPLGPGLHHDVCMTYEFGRYSTVGDGSISFRNYSIYIPDAYDGSTPFPLYVWFHGSDVGSNPDQITAYTDALDWPGVGASPNDLGAIWVAPISYPGNWSGSEWEFGWETLETVACIYNIDPARIYMGGFSSGGGAALVLGLIPGFADTYVAAFGSYSTGNTPASLAGSGLDPCALSRKVPIFLAAGSSDVNRNIVKQWEQTLAGCYPPERFTYYEWDGGHNWSPQIYAGIEWPWLSGWTLP